ncbi:XRE family transcriptional regulator [Staphylococcus aureus]|uniref:XRE family transcriptional regulator n=1 Tax=Staphylococcus aureus TaxID=1280 RepID=UPI001F3A25F7|nr:XRE family transcriptional regulator [Staphylococcus aureus]
MTTRENEKMSDKDLMEEVDKRRKGKDLTVREIGYLLGFSDTYFIKLRNGSRRITDRKRDRINRYLNGEYDNVKIPKYSRDSEQVAYDKGYKQALKDLEEFVNNKKLLLATTSNSIKHLRKISS